MKNTTIIIIVCVGLLICSFMIFKISTFERNCDTLVFHGWSGKRCCKFCEARGGNYDWREVYPDGSVKCGCMNGEYTVFKPKYIESVTE
jgi:hypothetical protein